MVLFKDYFSSFVSSERVHLFGNLQQGRLMGAIDEGKAQQGVGLLQVSVRLVERNWSNQDYSEYIEQTGQA